MKQNLDHANGLTVIMVMAKITTMNARALSAYPSVGKSLFILMKIFHVMPVACFTPTDVYVGCFVASNVGMLFYLQT